MEQCTAELYERLTVEPIAPSRMDWNDEGVVYRDKMIPEDLLQAYEACWLANNHNRPGGWLDCTPYRRHPELLNLLSNADLHWTMEGLIGEPAGVHLNLTGWVSTERNWHQDTYLNPPHVGDYYIAVWIALDDISPESGPFQFIPGSHRWRVVTREKILAELPPEHRDHRWPKFSEDLLTPIYDELIRENQCEVVSYTPRRGDVLFWHGRLVHRGSIAKTPGSQRRALIAHYSGIHHRSDMPPAERYKDGWFFPVDGGSV